MRLQGLYDKYSRFTDKGTVHSYLELYNQLLYPFIGKKAVVLELGVDTGGSLLLWKEYLGDAAVLGVDIKSCPELLLFREGIFFHQIDCVDRAAIEREFAGVTFDVIIDDASHLPSSQVASFELLYPKLKVGGLYVIEDCQKAETQRIQAMNDGAVDIFDLRSTRNRVDDIIAVINKRDH